MFNNFDKSQVIALMLIASLLVNAIVHFTHPAYKYYKQQVEDIRASLDVRYTDYERNIATNIVPAIIEVSSNNMVSVEMALQSIHYGISTNSMVGVNSDNSKSENKTIEGHVFAVGSLRGFWSDGTAYYVGDDYMGGIVLHIGKSTISTTDGNYNIKRPAKSTVVAGSSINERIEKGGGGV